MPDSHTAHTAGRVDAALARAPWCIPAGDGNELVVCEGNDPYRPGRILFVLQAAAGMRNPRYETLAGYATRCAAVPDLLTALRVLLDCTNAIIGADIQDPDAAEAFQMLNDARAQARAAIAKAGGER